MATFFLDLEGGSDAADGTSFANRVKTWAKAATLVAAGDTLRVMASVGPVAMSVNATWVNRSWKLTLSSPVNADIDTGEEAWTASANVTCTNSTTRKEGNTSASIAVAAGFTTGLAAFKAITLTDFSGYEQISFWIQQTTGTLGAAASCSLKLCSDTAGATPVDTFDLPAIPALGVWQPMVINKGAALGSAIQSVALYVNTDNAAQAFLIDNIVAVKASGNQDALHHQMLVGKIDSLGGGGDDTQAWHVIRSIRGTAVCFDSYYASGPNNGLAETPNSIATETAYTFLPSFAPSSVVLQDVVCVWAGIPGSRIAISGGWNRTDMSTQTGYTIFSYLGGANTLTVTWSGNSIDITGLSFSRWVSFVINPMPDSTGTIGIIGTLSGNTVNSENGVWTIFNVNGSTLTVTGVGATFTLLVSQFSSGGITVTGGATATITQGSIPVAIAATVGLGIAIHEGGLTYGGLTFELYTADIQFTRDQSNTQDEWTVTWFKNGVRVTSGITSPTLQLIKRVDGTDLVAATAMTQIGTTGSYKLDLTGASRITVGEAIIAVVAATIDAGTRSFTRLIGRDSA